MQFGKWSLIFMSLTFCQASTLATEYEQSFNTSRQEKLLLSLAEPLVRASRTHCARTVRFLNCKPHVQVRFLIPSMPLRSTMSFQAGGYYRYVFPLCRRLWWTKMTFQCNPFPSRINGVIRIRGTFGCNSLCSTYIDKRDAKNIIGAIPGQKQFF